MTRSQLSLLLVPRSRTLASSRTKPQILASAEASSSRVAWPQQLSKAASTMIKRIEECIETERRNFRILQLNRTLASSRIQTLLLKVLPMTPPLIKEIRVRGSPFRARAARGRAWYRRHKGQALATRVVRACRATTTPSLPSVVAAHSAVTTRRL